MNSPKAIIADSFSRSAIHYDDAALVQQQTGNELLEEMQRVVPKGPVNVIADIGCGTGYFTTPLLTRYSPRQYIGIDIAQGMLDIANQRHQNESAITTWLCEDAEQLPLANASVDIIYSNFSLQWCENLPQLLSRFFAVLKPGGQCCFTTLGPTTLHELRSAWSSVDSFNHVNQFYSHKEWQQAINQQAFLIVQHYQRKPIVYYDSVRQLLLSLKTIGANTVIGKRRQTLTGKKRFNNFLAAYESFRQPQGLPASYEVDGWILQKAQ